MYTKNHRPFSNYQSHIFFGNLISDGLEKKPNPTSIINITSNITWLHGTTSAIFAMMKKLGRNELIPTGLLRKQYSIVPLCGELKNGVVPVQGGRRKNAVNYQNISGMRATIHGITTVIQYANAFSKFDLEKVKLNSSYFLDAIKNQINIEIDYSNDFNYLTATRMALKLLEINFIRLLLMDKDFAMSKADYIEQFEQTIIKANFFCKKYTEDSSERVGAKLIQKYLQKLLLLAKQGLSIIPDDSFRQAVFNQFPIVIASTTIKPTTFDKGVKDEVTVEGIVSLEKDIQYIFTDPSHINQLQQILKEMQLAHIQVLGFEALLATQSNEELTQLTTTLYLLLNKPPIAKSNDSDKQNTENTIIRKFSF